jgi:hypothetical protein
MWSKDELERTAMKEILILIFICLPSARILAQDALRCNPSLPGTTVQSLLLKSVEKLTEKIFNE